jgi:hypothetical protein
VELVGHSGDQNGFMSHLYLHRPSRSGYVVAFNTNARSKEDARRTTARRHEGHKGSVETSTSSCRRAAVPSCSAVAPFVSEA